MTVWATELTNILSIMTSLEQKITSRGNKLENVTHMQEKKNTSIPTDCKWVKILNKHKCQSSCYSQWIKNIFKGWKKFIVHWITDFLTDKWDLK